jgi:hypothetical protein
MRAVLAEREREAAARIAVAEERARIARELHDIVAHAMSVMVLQVGAVRHTLPPGLDDGQGRARTRRAGRPHGSRDAAPARSDAQATATASSSAPSQASMPSTRLPKTSVAPAFLCEARGRPAGPAPACDRPLGLSDRAGRLTNALKHAHASRADVTVRYGPDELALEVATTAQAPGTTKGHGHGLLGIRERVNIYGGRMSAGAAPSGGFVLSARLPVDRYQR